MSALGTKRQFGRCKAMSGVESKADCRLHVQTSQFDPYATSAAERTRFIILYRSPRRFAAEPDYHRCDASQAIGQLRT